MRGITAQSIERVLSGREKGIGPATLRGILAGVEPFYAWVVSSRNVLYDRGILGSRRLGVPVVSVGNITAGGTGKTPVVRWLAGRLRGGGMHPGVLLRGYQRDVLEVSDEQAMLEGFLGAGPGGAIVVHAQADRVAGGRGVLGEHPEVDVFVLDDGFQHRRLHRDFDLVLIDAVHPFGYGHVHPRGLLREPLRGLRRADAFILTRSDQVSGAARQETESVLRRHNPSAPIYRARHVQTGLRSAAAASSDEPDIALERLAGTRFFAVAGIAAPRSLDRQLAAFGSAYRGHHWLDDHHAYQEDDVQEMRRQAREAQAEVIVVTEKDWAKLKRLPSAMDDSMPIWRIDVEVAFEGDGERGLLELIQARIDKAGRQAAQA